MKKILMYGLSNYIGGIETFIRNIFTYLCEDYQFYFPYMDNIAYEEEIKTLGGKFIYGFPTSRRNPLAYYRAWEKAFKENQFDVVYFNNCDIVNLDVLKLAKKYKVPIRIFHAHSTSSNTIHYGMLHQLEATFNKKRINKIATHLFACSDEAGKYMFGVHPFQVITNGIDTQKYRFDEAKRNSTREELGIRQETVYLYVGRLKHIKNPLFMADLIKCLHQLDENSIGLICGEGSLKAELEAKIVENQSGEYVRLLGNREDLDCIYAAADFLIVPSFSEGMPFTLIEAQCSGLKCICSDKVAAGTNLSGTVEYYPLELAPEGWAERIVKLPTDYDRTGGKDVIREAGFDIAQTAQVIKDIFEGKK